jgi:hypothetical protein
MTRITQVFVTVSVLAVLLVGSTAQAAITSDAAASYQLDATTVDASRKLTVSNPDGWGSSRPQHQAVWAFELPDLGGEDILAADLSIAYLRQVNIGSDQQTISLFVRDALNATSDVTTDDYIAPADDLNPVGWTLLEADFITGDSAPTTNYTLSTSGQANLLTYLKDNYVVGNFLLISGALDTNGFTGNFDRYEFDTVNSRVDGDPPIGPYQLSIEVVPEPTTMAVLGLGVIGLIKRRR